MTGRIPKDFIDQLLTRINIVDVIQTRLPLKKAGREYMACCPFHGEKTPSFTVSPTKQFYHCFGCGAHGSAIGFLMEYEHLDYTEAIEALARILGIEVPRERDAKSMPLASKAKLADLYSLLTEAAKLYTHCLTQALEAQAYLQQRGLSMAVVQQYSLGFSPDDWHTTSRQFAAQYGQDKLLASGLQLKNEAGKIYDRFRGRLMFPIRNRKGQVIGFGGRVLGTGTPKYLNSPETEVFHKGSELYGLFEARQQTRQLERLLVVEGYVDVIALAQFGISYAVATLGTATTQQHINLLFRQVPEVIFCFDGDRAGKEAAWRALETALPELRDGREVRFLFLPSGEDPDTQIRKVGRAAFEDALTRALPLSKFFTLGLKEELGFKAESTLHVSEDSALFANEAKRLLDLMPDILLKQPLMQEIQRLSGLALGQELSLTEEPKSFRQQNPKFKGKYAEHEPQGVRAKTAKDFEVRKTPVRYAITLLVHSPELATEIEHPEKLLDWGLPGLDLLVKLVATIEEFPQMHAAALLERFRDTPHEKTLLKLMLWQPQSSDEALLRREFQDCLRRMKVQATDKAVERLVAKDQTQGLSEQEKHDLFSLLNERHVK
ncbi:DNA primase [uncultured Thiothrix sp.]|uniref:DNA primase n=1 Tax=uncultured Thiothrix sp. TaxID=223185 RepID=UPI0026196D69|nr:DNA primase [uncultured Thiothrix sp.]HMT93491.1 DNA primase [Thiolinea sp.]